MDQTDLEQTLKNIFTPSDSNKWKTSEKIALVTKEIERIENSIEEYVNNCDVDIETIINDGNELCDESSKLLTDIELLHNKIEQCTLPNNKDSLEKRDEISKDAIKINYITNIIEEIEACNKFFICFDECMNKKSYSKAVAYMKDILNIADNPSDGLKDLKIHYNIQLTLLSAHKKILKEVEKSWNNNLSWKNLSKNKSSTITIINKFEENDEGIDLANAIASEALFDPKICEFSDFLLNCVLIPLVREQSVVTTEKEYIYITINKNSNTPNTYASVLSNLHNLLSTLDDRLCIPLKTGGTLMSRICQPISEEFTNILIKECLMKTVPNNINEMQLYAEVTTEIEKFQNFLLSINFFAEKNQNILKYLTDIDELFANKSSEYFLDTARQIMLKDLSAMMSIGVESVAEEDVKTELDGALAEFDKIIPKSLFYFPRCMISKSAQELLDMIYSMMEQASQSPDIVAKKLYHASRLIFELYDAVVPYHHEKFLNTIPQYVALFHNNCIYLAHHLQTLGHKWLQAMKGKKVNYAISFIDLVQRLRLLGCHHLTLHLQQQRKQILNNIQGSALGSITMKVSLGESAEQAVRQCLRQLQLLKNVWIGVMPPNVFMNLMNTLVNMFLDTLISRVCSAEDITADMAQQFCDIYGIVVKKAPNLFQNEKDIESTKCWLKLQYLISILGSSLIDIEQNFNSGKGPLAQHFDREELRNLVKALFQNTQMRANLLTKIKTVQS